jgi:TolA-binding protein
MKMKKINILTLAAIFSAINLSAFAQEPVKPEELSREIISAKDSGQVFSSLKKAKDLFAAEGKYNEFCDFLKELSAKKKPLAPFSGYFCGLSRYEQLRYLEEKQSWDEYFNKGNDYRQELTSGLEEAVKATTAKEPLQVYAKLLLWQFHQDQQDTFAEESLASLMETIKAYALEAQDPAPLKSVADKLQSYDKKGPAKEIYKAYIDKVANSGLKDEELKALAEGFFNDKNLELAETVYDTYIEKTAKTLAKEKLALELAGIAGKFAYKDTGSNDPAYAEKIFAKIEALAGKDAFDEKLSYFRAYNLERAREFEKAKAVYIDLLSRFPNSPYLDKVNFKLGVISGYVLRDINNAREYFQKLAGKETANPEVISSLYQLGILAQWQEDQERAKANYLKLKEKAGSEFKSTTALADERLKEIEENKPLQANILFFLEVSLKDEYSSFNMSKLDLKSSAYNLKKGQEFSVTATAYPPESGCMPVSLEYGWAGDLGKAVPLAQDSSFTSSYSDPGIKIIGLVVRTSGGVIDRAVDMIDVE